MARHKAKRPSIEDTESAVKLQERRPSGMMSGPLGGTIKATVRDLKAGQELQLKKTTKDILEGRISLELDPDQIIDEVDTDRMIALGDEKEFESLVENIRLRGQRQPIRVRPVDPNWNPDPENPTLTNDKFIVQSGRRRIAACKKLGVKVLALVSVKTELKDLTLDDLIERMTENTMRADLSPWERMLSIGEIMARSEKTQSDVADLLGVGRPTISQAQSCYKYRDQLEAMSEEINALPLRRIIAMIPEATKRADGITMVKTKTAPKHLTVERDGQRLKLSTGHALQATAKGQIQVFGKDDKIAKEEDALAVMDLIEAALKKAKIKPKA